MHLNSIGFFINACFYPDPRMCLLELRFSLCKYVDLWPKLSYGWGVSTLSKASGVWSLWRLWAWSGSTGSSKGPFSNSRRKEPSEIQPEVSLYVIFNFFLYLSISHCNHYRDITVLLSLSTEIMFDFTWLYLFGYIATSTCNIWMILQQLTPGQWRKGAFRVNPTPKTR